MECLGTPIWRRLATMFRSAGSVTQKKLLVSSRFSLRIYRVSLTVPTSKRTAGSPKSSRSFRYRIGLRARSSSANAYTYRVDEARGLDLRVVSTKNASLADPLCADYRVALPAMAILQEGDDPRTPSQRRDRQPEIDWLDRLRTALRDFDSAIWARARKS